MGIACPCPRAELRRFGENRPARNNVASLSAVTPAASTPPLRKSLSFYTPDCRREARGHKSQDEACGCHSTFQLVAAANQLLYAKNVCRKFAFTTGRIIDANCRLVPAGGRRNRPAVPSRGDEHIDRALLGAGANVVDLRDAVRARHPHKLSGLDATGLDVCANQDAFDSRLGVGGHVSDAAGHDSPEKGDDAMEQQQSESNHPASTTPLRGAAVSAGHYGQSPEQPVVVAVDDGPPLATMLPEHLRRLNFQFTMKDVEFILRTVDPHQSSLELALVARADQAATDQD